KCGGGSGVIALPRQAETDAVMIKMRRARVEPQREAEIADRGLIIAQRVEALATRDVVVDLVRRQPAGLIEIRDGASVFVQIVIASAASEVVRRFIRFKLNGAREIFDGQFVFAPVVKPVAAR